MECTYVEKGDKLKWLNFKDLAIKSIESIMQSFRDIFPQLTIDELQLIEKLRSQAKKGYLPDPKALEELAETEKSEKILALAALTHREIARLLASIYFSEHAYIDEAIGAYIQALSLLIGLASLLHNKRRILEETLRTLGELIFIAEKEKEREDINRVIITVRTIIEGILKTLNIGD